MVDRGKTKGLFLHMLNATDRIATIKQAHPESAIFSIRPHSPIPSFSESLAIMIKALWAIANTQKRIFSSRHSLAYNRKQYTAPFGILTEANRYLGDKETLSIWIYSI